MVTKNDIEHSRYFSTIFLSKLPLLMIIQKVEAQRSFPIFRPRKSTNLLLQHLSASN